MRKECAHTTCVRNTECSPERWVGHGSRKRASEGMLAQLEPQAWSTPAANRDMGALAAAGTSPIDGGSALAVLGLQRH